jgi:hypothetical protein
MFAWDLVDTLLGGDAMELLGLDYAPTDEEEGQEEEDPEGVTDSTAERHASLTGLR